MNRLRLDDMLGNNGAIGVLRKMDSGLVLIHGDIGCGKTTAAMALAHEKAGIWLDEFATDGRPFILPDGNMGWCSRYLGTDMDRTNLWPSGLHTPHIFYKRFIHIVDEAHLIPRRVLNRMPIANTAPPGYLYIFCTSNPNMLPRAIRDRLAAGSVELGPLSPPDIRRLAQRHCLDSDIAYTDQLGNDLCRFAIDRPRSIISVVELVRKGVAIEDAIRTVIQLR